MTLMRTSRLAATVCLAWITAVHAARPVPTMAAASCYTHVATLPHAVDGQPFRDFAFDDKTRRLYAGSAIGLYWSDLNEEKPVFKGPLFRKTINRIEMAPDLGRVFYIAGTEIGYLDVRNTSAEPIAVVAGRPRGELLRGPELVYERTRRQIYVANGTERVIVLDASSGERAPNIRLPGWSATGLEAVPGRVFMNVSGKKGIHQIDAATHAVTAWLIGRELVTPARFKAEPSGRTLFAAYDRFIVAIDIASGKQLGHSQIDVARGSRLGQPTTGPDPVMAFDAGTGWLVASWRDESPRLRLKAFSMTPRGFTEQCTMDNPVGGELGLEPISHGFIQRGYKSLLVWAAK